MLTEKVNDRINRNCGFPQKNRSDPQKTSLHPWFVSPESSSMLHARDLAQGFFAGPPAPLQEF